MDLRNVPTSEVMNTAVISLEASMTLEDARDVFLTNDISGAPVVDEQNLLLGVVSQKDLIKVGLGGDFDDFGSNELLIGFTAWGAGGDSETIQARLKSKLVSDVMSNNIFSARPEDHASYLASEMRRHRIHRIIVTDESRRVVGIVTPFDLLKLLEA